MTAALQTPPRPRYIILRLDDAKALAVAAKGIPTLAAVTSRLELETGADIEEIVSLLKGQPLCLACVTEGQERDCESLGAQKVGRRLRRLVERANATNNKETTT